MLCALKSIGLEGIRPYLVSVEVDFHRGLPGFDIVGLPDAAVKESRERVKSAALNLGYPQFNAKIIANLAPAGTRKAGATYDLAILIALLCAAGYEHLDFSDTALVGEIGLDGELRPVLGVLAMVLDAAALGVSRVIVPYGNAAEAAVASGMEVRCAKTAGEVIAFGKGELELPCANRISAAPPPKPDLPDFSDVKGQEESKRAMEIAAAGGHNLLMIGPPGSGKSMLATRLSSILPDLTEAESIESTKIYSVAGMLAAGSGLLDRRPFRSPHHTISQMALVGGGKVIRPGELSLAHNGVLFLDELPEFQKNALEALRQPLEEGWVHISRVQQQLSFPSKVMLVAAMNPCPCGFYGHPGKDCTCTPNAIQRYLNRVSGPLLDRIDIHTEVGPVDYAKLTGTAKRESSREIRERVNRARKIQTQRYQGTGITNNAALPPAMLDAACIMDDSAKQVLKAAFDRLGLSARGYDRILKVARTIADLEASEKIAATHIAQAVQFRSLDRKYWNG